MAHQQLAQKLNMALHQAGMILYIRIEFFQLIHFLTYSAKNFCNRLIAVAAHAMEERVTWFNIQFYGRYTRAVLPAVMLFFHQQVQFIESPHYSAIFLLVVGKRLS